MKILLVHNEYLQPGGEDAVQAAERGLLSGMGHSVVEYRRHNRELRASGGFDKIALARRTVWAADSYEAIRACIHRERPAVAHFHNTFPLVSPAAYYACREAAVPVVQTLHNYRLFCPAASFFRNGHLCEECVEHSLWRGVRYGCYRGSRLTTATVAAMLAFHRQRQTWTEMVSCYIALTEFARAKFTASGLPSHKIVVKPNFVHADPGVRLRAGDYALFVGRLSPEKGPRILLDAWERLNGRIPLYVAGDGPLRAELELQKSQRGLVSVTFLGWLSSIRTLAAVKGCRFLVFPSEWYECFPATIVEAFACGVPVIASRLGAMREIIEDGTTGRHFAAGDAADLAEKVEWAWTHPKELEEMGRAARAQYEAKYTAERNYRMLTEIYRRVQESRV
ncbi:MAG: glycosyltransferase [Acidobacteriota bacterium]